MRQKREERRHHQGREKVSEEIEAPDRQMPGIRQKLTVGGVARHEEHREHQSELLAAEVPTEPAEYDYGQNGHYHVENLGEQLRLRSVEQPPQEIESVDVVELNEHGLLDRLQNPEAGDHEKEVAEHRKREGQFFTAYVQDGA